MIEKDTESRVVQLPHGLMWSTDPVFRKNDTSYDILEEFIFEQSVLMNAQTVLEMSAGLVCTLQLLH